MLLAARRVGIILSDPTTEVVPGVVQRETLSCGTVVYRLPCPSSEMGQRQKADFLCHLLSSIMNGSSAEERKVLYAKQEDPFAGLHFDASSGEMYLLNGRLSLRTDKRDFVEVQIVSVVPSNRELSAYSSLLERTLRDFPRQV